MENLYDIDYIIELASDKLGIDKNDFSWKPFQQTGVINGTTPTTIDATEKKEIYFVKCDSQTEWDPSVNPPVSFQGSEFVFHETMDKPPLLRHVKVPASQSWTNMEMNIPYGLYKRMIIAGSQPESTVKFMIQGIKLSY